MEERRRKKQHLLCCCLSPWCMLDRFNMFPHLKGLEKKEGSCSQEAKMVCRGMEAQESRTRDTGGTTMTPFSRKASRKGDENRRAHHKENMLIILFQDTHATDSPPANHNHSTIPPPFHTQTFPLRLPVAFSLSSLFCRHVFCLI